MQKNFPYTLSSQIKPSPTTMHYCEDPGLVFLTSAEGIFCWNIAVSCSHLSLFQANQVQVHQFLLTGQVLQPPECLRAPLLKLLQLINFISLSHIDEPRAGCGILDGVKKILVFLSSEFLNMVLLFYSQGCSCPSLPPGHTVGSHPAFHLPGPEFQNSCSPFPNTYCCQALSLPNCRILPLSIFNFMWYLWPHSSSLSVSFWKAALCLRVYQLRKDKEHKLPLYLRQEGKVGDSLVFAIS